MLPSGSVDAVAGAITTLLTMWDKTRGAQKVKAIKSLCNSVLYLNANDPKLHSLRDFTDQDRIALSGVGFSMQATLLQMAAGQAFGEGQEKPRGPVAGLVPHPGGRGPLLSGHAPLGAAPLTPPPLPTDQPR